MTLAASTACGKVLNDHYSVFARVQGNVALPPPPPRDGSFSSIGASEAGRRLYTKWPGLFQEAGTPFYSIAFHALSKEAIGTARMNTGIQTKCLGLIHTAVFKRWKSKELSKWPYCMC